MGYELKLAKSFSRIEPQRLGLGLLTGFLLSLTYLSPSIYYALPLPTLNLRLSWMNAAPPSPMINDSMMSSPNLGVENVTHEGKLRCDGSSPRRNLCEKVGVIRMNENASSTTSDDSLPGRENVNSTQLPIGNKKESTEGSQISDDPKPDQLEMNGDEMVSKNSSNTTITIESTQKNVTSDSKQSGGRREDVKPKETRPMCDFSNRRSNLCEMDGDIRIHGKSSSVVFITSSQTGSSKRNESWRIKPYARKTDLTAMAGVRELSVKSSDGYEDPPHCTLNHSVPAIVFSVAGYTGNFFHDFTDILVPLFLTSYQFSGEVQFLVTNFHTWWIHKYLPILSKLSQYEIIDLDGDNRVHCFPHVIVGLNSHDDLRINTWRSPNGYSMVDFTKFLRSAYSLPKETPVTVGEHSRKKPRLMIIARSRTRKFTNIKKIVKMAEKLGYEVTVGEAESNVTRFAHTVNSCDVMIGVHGAGLTNFVFLPTNAILIQIVPWGKLDWIAHNYFREPAKGMNLRYLEYSISEEESTLTELYPRDHPVFKDPLSIHKGGWNSLGEIFLQKQNVKLNVRRFRAVLLKALKLLHEQ